MSDDDGIRIHGFKVQDGVFEGFSFDSAAGIKVEVYDIRTQSLCSQLEGTPGSSAGLEEEVDYGFSSECGNFLDLSGGYFVEGVCCIEHRHDLGR